MNTDIVKMNLRNLAKRVDSLKERLEEIKETRKVRNRNGYVEGEDSPMWTIDEYLGKYAEEFYTHIIKKYPVDSCEYNIKYHMENVKYVIDKYLKHLILKTAKIDNEVLDCDIGGLKMVHETLLKIVEEM